MKKPLSYITLIVLIALIFPLVSSAHYIVGRINDAFDGTSANGKILLLWNPSNGINDNLTDTVGPSGNSGANNIYLLDCELLNTPCSVGDDINVRIINNGDNYISATSNLSVTGAGFDTMSNMTLNSPPIVTSIALDDSIISPSGEIDLTPASTTQITCEGIILEYDGNSSLSNVTAEFFDNSASAYGNTDDNNLHYSNSSCLLDRSYGNGNESSFTCSFQVEYYANSGNWNCTIKATDNLSISSRGSNTTNINPLLALSVSSPLDFGEINASEVGSEKEINVTNVGNMAMNLSLSGYAVTVGDGLAMNCTIGETKNISIEYAKYNLTQSNPGNLNLTEFETVYTNLTSNPIVKKLNLNYRQDDVLNNAFNTTYWRIYVPGGVGGNCSGNIVFGAVQSAGT